MPEKIQAFHISDCVEPDDTARARVGLMYGLLEDKYGVTIDYQPVPSQPGNSFHTGFQALQLLGESAHQATRLQIPERQLTILVNNASRARHADKTRAGGSQCLWARVRTQTGAVHNVVGVDDEVFSVLKPDIVELRVVTGIPDDPAFEDLSNGTQFRSLYNFTRAQIAIAVRDVESEFLTTQVPVDRIDDISLKPNEALLGDRDRFGNCKLLTTHASGIMGLCFALDVELDSGKIEATFEGWSGASVRLRPTQFLGKHPGQHCAWNGSSRTPSGGTLMEMGVSRTERGERLKEIEFLPIGTKIIFRKAL